jgi:hypothetical protein
LHDRRSCWERGLQGALAEALKVELSTDERDALMAYAEALPDEVNALNE